MGPKKKQISPKKQAKKMEAPNMVEIPKEVVMKQKEGYTCEKCDKHFLDSLDYLNHVRSHDVRPYACAMCDMAFYKKESLNRHAEGHILEKTISCPSCPVQFRNYDRLKEHLKFHIPLELKKRFKCDYCEKSYTTKLNLDAHVRNHLGVKPYKCNVCEKTFHAQNNLTKHRAVHSEERYQCNICGSFKKSKNSLRIHTKLHVSKSNTCKKEIQCDQCSKRFPNNFSLAMHMDKSHNQVRFKCPICNKVFKYKNTLDNHLKHHKKGDQHKNANPSPTRV